MAGFHYPALELQQKQIRVIWILPDEPDKIIRCQMTTIPLDGQHIALSYVWGTDHPIHRIEINGKPFYVRQNLHDFLRHARTMYLGEFLWVDAICIDQSNTRERNHQVRQMNRIYSSAQAVVSWLGCGDAELEEWLPQDSSISITGSSIDTISRYIEETTTEAILDNLQTISGFDYWDRLWIVPEVLGASKLQLLYGYQSLSWPDLGVILDHVSSDEDTLNKVRTQQLREIKWSKMATFVRERLADLEEAQQYDLQSLLRSYGMNDCSDKRDRVFALITLAEDVGASQIDYNESAEALCVRILGLQKMTISELCPFAMHLFAVLELSILPSWPLINTDLAASLHFPIPIKKLQYPLRKKDVRWPEVRSSVLSFKHQQLNCRPAKFSDWLNENRVELFETLDLDARFTIVTERKEESGPRHVICIIRQFIWKASPELSIDSRNYVYRVPDFGVLQGDGMDAHFQVTRWASLQICLNIFLATPVTTHVLASRKVLDRGFKRRPFEFPMNPLNYIKYTMYGDEDVTRSQNWGFQQLEWCF